MLSCPIGDDLGQVRVLNFGYRCEAATVPKDHHVDIAAALSEPAIADLCITCESGGILIPCGKERSEATSLHTKRTRCNDGNWYV